MAARTQGVLYRSREIYPWVAVDDLRRHRVRPSPLLVSPGCTPGRFDHADTHARTRQRRLLVHVKRKVRCLSRAFFSRPNVIPDLLACYLTGTMDKTYDRSFGTSLPEQLSDRLLQAGYDPIFSSAARMTGSP